MKITFRSGTALCALAAWATTVAAAETRMQVSAAATPIYAQASASGQKVGTATQGEILFVARVEGDWAAISPPDRLDLWLNKDFIEGNRVVAKSIQIRSGPGIEYGIVGTLERGAPVMPRGEQGEWCKIAPPSSTILWVKNGDLTEVRTHTAPIQNVAPVPEPPKPAPAPPAPAPAPATPAPVPQPAAAAPQPSTQPAPTPAPEQASPTPAPVAPPKAPAKVTPSTPGATPPPAAAPKPAPAAAPKPAKPAAPTATSAPKPAPAPKPAAAAPAKAPVAPKPQSAIARAAAPAAPTLRPATALPVAPSQPATAAGTRPAAPAGAPPANAPAPKPPTSEIQVDQAFVDDLELTDMPNQGKPVQVEGELRNAPFMAGSPSRYRLQARDDDGALEMICHVHGDSEILRDYVGQNVSIRGREYWVEDSDMPVVVVGQVVPLDPPAEDEPVMF